MVCLSILIFGYRKSSKHRLSQDGMIKISILDVKEEAIDDMFSNIRTYFSKNGFLTPKENTDTSVPLPEASFNEESKEANFQSDCEVPETEAHTDRVYGIETFKFKNKVCPKYMINDAGTSKPAIVFGNRKNTTLSKPVNYGFDLVHGYHKLTNKTVVGPSSFKVLRLLGIGSFGEVFLVEKIDNGHLYAMKILKKDTVYKRKLIKYAKVERNVM